MEHRKFAPLKTTATKKLLSVRLGVAALQPAEAPPSSPRVSEVTADANQRPENIQNAGVSIQPSTGITHSTASCVGSPGAPL